MNSMITYNRFRRSFPAAMSNMRNGVNLEYIPLFSGMTEKQRDWMFERLSKRVFARDQELITVGLPGEFLYIILSGTVKVYNIQKDGEEVIVAILGPGDPVGEMSLIDSSSRSASVIALEETCVLWMDQYSFQESLQVIPALAKNLIGILNNRLRNSTAQIQALAALDVQQRVIHQLLLFAERYGKPGKYDQTFIPIRLTQSDLAGLVGASRKRVNQAFVILKQKNWIEVDTDFHITLIDRVEMERQMVI